MLFRRSGRLLVRVFAGRVRPVRRERLLKAARPRLLVAAPRVSRAVDCAADFRAHRARVRCPTIAAARDSAGGAPAAHTCGRASSLSPCWRRRRGGVLEAPPSLRRRRLDLVGAHAPPHPSQAAVARRRRGRARRAAFARCAMEARATELEEGWAGRAPPVSRYPASLADAHRPYSTAPHVPHAFSTILARARRARAQQQRAFSDRSRPAYRGRRDGSACASRRSGSAPQPHQGAVAPFWFP